MSRSTPNRENIKTNNNSSDNTTSTNSSTADDENAQASVAPNENGTHDDDDSSNEHNGFASRGVTRKLSLKQITGKIRKNGHGSSDDHRMSSIMPRPTGAAAAAKEAGRRGWSVPAPIPAVRTRGRLRLLLHALNGKAASTPSSSAHTERNTSLLHDILLFKHTKPHRTTTKEDIRSIGARSAFGIIPFCASFCLRRLRKPLS